MVDKTKLCNETLSIDDSMFLENNTSITFIFVSTLNMSTKLRLYFHRIFVLSF